MENEINEIKKPSNAKKENPTKEELSAREYKKIKMAEYRERLKHGRVNGPVNQLGEVVVQVNTQINITVLENFRNTLEDLNKENDQCFTSAQMLTKILNIVLPAIEIKMKDGEPEIFVNDHILQHNNLLEFNPKLVAINKNPTKKLKI